MDLDFNNAAPVGGGPDARGARARRGGNRGGTGAPPSNTAPDNCIPLCRPLRWGIDSLYLSYPGKLADHRESELRKLKSVAQSAPHEAAKAQIALGDHVFEVRDKSSGLFAFALADGAFMIRLASVRSKSAPMAYVQVSSGLLAYKTVPEIERELRGILEQLGDVDPPRVSRVDVFVDFESAVDMESWDRRAWVTKAGAVHHYAEGKHFTGWTVGAGGPVMARLYQKVIECRKSGKEYLFDLWRQAGWDGDTAVWRLEFEFKREILGQLGLDGVHSVMQNLAGLWSYATTDWLRLCVPSESDATRSRWPVHVLWAALAEVDWLGNGGPLLRSFRPTRAPGTDFLGSRLLALYASAAAIVGDLDFDAAAVTCKGLAWDALARQNGLSGISNDQFFAEKVEGLVRVYNLRMNAPAKEVPDSDDYITRNPYYRAKQGLPDL